MVKGFEESAGLKTTNFTTDNENIWIDNTVLSVNLVKIITELERAFLIFIEEGVKTTQFTLLFRREFKMITNDLEDTKNTLV